MSHHRGRRLSLLMLLAPASASAAALDVRVQDQDGQPLADAVVFARPAGNSTALRAQTAIIDQIGKKFEPRVSALATGTTVTFPNKDDIKHHVYSFSPPKVFQLKLYHGVTADPVTFDEPGLVVLGCNIHDGMIAYVYIVDAPYFGLTDATGSMQLASLPAGDYELQTWHYQMNDEAEAATPVKLTVGASTPAQSLVLALRRDIPLPPPLE